MQSYLPDGVLEEFVAQLDELDEEARCDVVTHRRVKNVWGYSVGGHRIVAKVYDDGDEGRDAFRIWRTLWTAGFGPGSVHRVPEPLTYLADRGVLLMEPAPGDCLLSLVFGAPQACADGMRAAASWLADLHTSTVRVGPSDNAARVLYSLTRRVARAVAQHPQLESTMFELVSELERRGDAFSKRGPSTVVQTHGRYHCEHVFVAAGAVTVVDVDRAAPGDPAKDVAELLTRFRIEALKLATKKGRRDDVAAPGTRAFVEHYQRHSPQELFGLLYYWSATLLTMMLRDVLKPHLDEAAWNRRLALFEHEFGELPGVVSELGWTA